MLEIIITILIVIAIFVLIHSYQSGSFSDTRKEITEDKKFLKDWDGKFVEK